MINSRARFPSPGLGRGHLLPSQARHMEPPTSRSRRRPRLSQLEGQFNYIAASLSRASNLCARPSSLSRSLCVPVSVCPSTKNLMEAPSSAGALRGQQTMANFTVKIRPPSKCAASAREHIVRALTTTTETVAANGRGLGVLARPVCCCCCAMLLLPCCCRCCRGLRPSARATRPMKRQVSGHALARARPQSQSALADN